MKFKSKLMIPLTISVFVLFGCNGDVEENSDTKGNDDSTTLNLAMGTELPTLKSNAEIDAVSATMMSNIFEGLYRKSKDGTPTEGIAEDYDQEGKIYTFNLREDAEWMNGDPVTAGDFIYAWKKALHPDTFSPHADLLKSFKNASEIQDQNHEMYGEVDKLGVKAIDKKTLELTLDDEVPYILDVLSHPVSYPQNEDFVKEQGDNYALEVENLVSNGPYELTEWNHGQGWVLEKNEDYWDAETVETQKINFKVVKDVATKVNLYETGAIDVADVSSEFVEEYQDDDNYVTAIQNEAYFLRLNQENEYLKNVNIRRALDMGYDKEAMTDDILKTGAIPAYYLIPPDFPEFESPSGEDFRNKNGDLNKGSIEEAQKLFKEGLNELGEEEITLNLLSYDDGQRKSVAEYIKHQWENNLPGLNITINQQPNKQKLSLEGKQDYDISHSGWRNTISDPDYTLSVFLSDGSYNWQDFKNDEYDKLVRKAQTDFSDNEERFSDLQEAERILIEEEVAISPMYISSSAKLVKPYVEDLIFHANNTASYKWVKINK